MKKKHIFSHELFFFGQWRGPLGCPKNHQNTLPSPKKWKKKHILSWTFSFFFGTVEGSIGLCREGKTFKKLPSQEMKKKHILSWTFFFFGQWRGPLGCPGRENHQKNALPRNEKNTFCHELFFLDSGGVHWVVQGRKTTKKLPSQEMKKTHFVMNFFLYSGGVHWVVQGGKTIKKLPS